MFQAQQAVIQPTPQGDIMTSSDQPAWGILAERIRESRNPSIQESCFCHPAVGNFDRMHLFCFMTIFMYYLHAHVKRFLLHF